MPSTTPGEIDGGGGPVGAAGRAVPRPTPVDLLATIPFGLEDRVPPLPASRGDVHAALEAVLIPALTRPPCVVSFSGGRDSSAVLAVATDVARRHGLELPVPVIMRFPQAPLSDERRWQELVLGHLGLANAEVVTLSDELELLGPPATDALRRHGLLWPSNAYMHRPVIDLARGGTVLTGVGGDELLDAAPRPTWRGRAVAALPRSVRARIWLRRYPPEPRPWLTPAGQQLIDRAFARDHVSWPHRWDVATRRWYESRVYSSMATVLDLIASDHGARVVSPLIDPQVLAELIALGGRWGFPSRTEAMRTLVGHLLPAALVERPTKAAFGAALWGPHTREWISQWQGDGLDPRYVDVEALRAQWSSEDPDGRTALLLHQAWLSTSSS
jgi:hypothetical protein